MRHILLIYFNLSKREVVNDLLALRQFEAVWNTTLKKSQETLMWTLITNGFYNDIFKNNFSSCRLFFGRIVSRILRIRVSGFWFCKAQFTQESSENEFDENLCFIYLENEVDNICFLFILFSWNTEVDSWRLTSKSGIYLLRFLSKAQGCKHFFM